MNKLLTLVVLIACFSLYASAWGTAWYDYPGTRLYYDRATGDYAEGQTANVTYELNSSTAGAVTVNLTWFANNGSYYNMTQVKTVPANTSLTVFSFYPIVGALQGASLGQYMFQNFTINATLEGEAAQNQTWKYLFTYPTLLTNCSAAFGPALSIATLNMSVYNESNSAPLNETIIETSATYYLFSSGIQKTAGYTFNTSAKYYNATCVYPGWAVLPSSDFTIVYRRTGYEQRMSFVKNATLTNSTQNMSLYLLPSSLSEQVIIYVVDENGNTVEGVTVKAQRWFVGNNSYVTVATILTDFEGKGSTYLYIPDTFYRFILEINGTVQSTTSPTIIICRSGTCPPYTLTLPLNTLSDAAYFTRIGKLAYQCSYSNATNSSVCTVYDVSGIDVAANLTVKRLDMAGYTTICSDEQAGSGVTLTCALGATAGHYYQYFLYAKRATGEYDLLETGLLDLHGIEINWGMQGILLGLILFLTMVGAGAWNPVATMLLGFVALVAGYFLHILPVDASVLIGLGAVVGLAVWKMRS